MTTLEFPVLSPAETLAAEEAILDAADAGNIGQMLSFWEPSKHFVVLGYGNKVATETRPDACERLGVQILRRCSGGGTVLQGPGVLNYSLVLGIDKWAHLSSITGANQFIMQRNADALGRVLGRPVSVQGYTDLAIAQLKFSGNAQRRKRTHLLFHGAILLNLDMMLLDAVLPMPSLQPGYRGGRTHGEFLTQLGLPPGPVKQALRAAWDANEPLNPDAPWPEWRSDIAKLVAEKYSRHEWNFRV
jgi:lipoate-protein ligase A